MTYRKKLIEVALPLDAINREAAREKSIRHGHPSTLHLWWARRPLAACRAVLFSSLVDDPSSDLVYRNPDGSVDEDRAGVKRAQLFNLIGELVKWDNSNNDTVINAARAEIARCVASRKLELGELQKSQKLPGGETVWDLIVKGHGDLAAIRSRHSRLPDPESVNAFLAEHAPPVLDPFCGGGSIPLEAQRLGLRVYASDLNPVPVLITKALIEMPPKFAGQPPVNPEWQEKSAEEKRLRQWHGAQGLADDVRYYGKWMRDEAERRIGELYPKVTITKEMVGNKDAPDYRPDLEPYVGQRLTVIAWIWARTVVCPNPACGGKTPIAKTFELSGKPGNEAHVEPIIDSHHRKVHFCVKRGRKASRPGNVNRRGAECLICNTPIPLEHIREEALATRMGQTMMAIVAEGHRNRLYLAPTADQVSAAEAATAVDAWRPTTDLPEHALGFRVQRYGMTSHAGLFSQRQIVALGTFADLVRHIGQVIGTSHCSADTYAGAIATYLAFAVSKAANYWSSLCSWYVGKEIMVSTFGLPTLSMVWDFAEANPFSDSSGNWTLGIEQAASAIENLFPTVNCAAVSQHDVTQYQTNEAGSPVFSTDPPYYDNIGYANLSDFFYVWLRRCLGDVYPRLFSTVLTPKDAELIAEPGRFGNDRDRAVNHFEHGSTLAFTRLRATADPAYPMTVFYAFKQQESEEADAVESHAVVSTGWEKMLESLIAAGCSIQGTWPMRTEQSGGLREAKRNALASSIVLVCRPRTDDAPMATRKDFVASLKQELPGALRDLQSGNIAPVDLAQAAIGPGMAIYSRYSRVVNSDGSRMSVRTALQLINQALDEVLSEQESEFDSDTRWAIKWFEQHSHEDGPFGDAETLSKAMAVSVSGLREAGLLKAGAGKVRLLRREELVTDWDPTTDKRLTIWEVTQHLIRRLESDGETGAAELRRQVGSLGDVARDLAYRLYSTCERKRWADEARSYNGLVVSWPEIERLARERRAEPSSEQRSLFDKE